jgi:hypothetical protein
VRREIDNGLGWSPNPGERSPISAPMTSVTVRRAPADRRDRAASWQHDGVRRPILCATAVLFLLVVGAPPVSAHSDTGLLSLETAPAHPPLSVQVRARLVYVNDRDPVSSATVTVEGTGPNGATVPPTALVSRGDGVYTATVTVPVAGAWTFRARSTAPTAAAETQVAVDRPPPTSATAAATTTTTSPAAPSSTTPARADTPPDDGGDGGGLWLAATVAIVLIAVAVGAAAWWRARRSATG